MEPQLLCLRWNNHQSNLVTVFDQLLQNEAFCDVTLAVDGKTIKCHKMVMAAASSYFQSIFMENTCKHPIVFLKDIKYSQIRSLLEYIYYGEASVQEEELPALLKIAETLKIKGLVEIEEDATKPSRESACDSRSSSVSKSSTIWPASPSKLMSQQHRDEDGVLVIDEEHLDKSNSYNMSPLEDSNQDYDSSYNISDETPPAPGMVRVVGPNGKAEWKRYKQYTKDDIVAAIEEVKNGMSALQASRKYGVPSRTLYDKVKKMGILTANMQKQIQQKKAQTPQSLPVNMLGLQLPQANLPHVENGHANLGVKKPKENGKEEPEKENAQRFENSAHPPIAGSLMMSMMSMMTEKLQAGGLLNRQSAPVSLTSLLRHTGNPGGINSREGSDSGHSSSDLGDGEAIIKEEKIEEPKMKGDSEPNPVNNLLAHLASLNNAAAAVNGAHSVTLTPRDESNSAAAGRKRKNSEEEVDPASQVPDCKKSLVDVEPMKQETM